MRLFLSSTMDDAPSAKESSHGFEDFPASATASATACESGEKGRQHLRFADEVQVSIDSGGGGNKESEERRSRESLSQSKSSQNMQRRGSLSESLRARLESEQSTKENKCSNLAKWWKEEKELKFRLFVLVLPSLLVMWYATAILFPPGVRGRFKLLLWDDGHLIINHDNDASITTISICPRPSICAEGLVQIIMLALARLTAFASYIFLGVVFISKMHFLMNFLSLTYVAKIVPFESLHKMHIFCAKVYGGLIFVHILTHCIRSILRSEIEYQLGTGVYVSGIIGAVAMFFLVNGMSQATRKNKNSCFSKFEVRFNAHWAATILLCVTLFVHTTRSRVLASIFLCLWGLDYIYGYIFATYNLKVVELLPLPNESGLQMLWRNPKGFHPRSGEYVQIQIPWLSKGSNEWHPFSIYLREDSMLGFQSVHNIGTMSSHLLDNEETNPNNETLDDLMGRILSTEFQNEAIDTLSSAFIEEARENIDDRYSTTQVFISPVGDWSKSLMQELQDQKQLRACWVRGPYTSPFHIANDYSHFVMMATGIGITPVLGVMGQYPGFSRTKILIWSLNNKHMLKFFIPLLKDAHMAVIYYTGKDKLDSEEVSNIRSKGNIYLQQSRPEAGFRVIVESIIVKYENHINLSHAETIKEVDQRKRAAWCVLYCGGVMRIRYALKHFSRANGLGFESESFGW